MGCGRSTEATTTTFTSPPQEGGSQAEDNNNHHHSTTTTTTTTTHSSVYQSDAVIATSSSSSPKAPPPHQHQGRRASFRTTNIEGADEDPFTSVAPMNPLAPPPSSSAIATAPTPLQRRVSNSGIVVQKEADDGFTPMPFVINTDPNTKPKRRSSIPFIVPARETKRSPSLSLSVNGPKEPQVNVEFMMPSRRVACTAVLPMGISPYDDHTLFVVDMGSSSLLQVCIQPKDPEIPEEKVLHIGTPLRTPYGIAFVHPDIIAVTDLTAHCVHIFRVEGGVLCLDITHIRSVGGEDMFTSPTGVAVLPPSGQLAVCDGRGGITIVTTGGTVIRRILCDPLHDGMRELSGICPINSSIVAVTDSRSQTVVIVSVEDGRVLRVIGTVMNGQLGLAVPHSAALAGKNMLVVACHRKLHVYRITDGVRMRVVEDDFGVPLSEFNPVHVCAIGTQLIIKSASNDLIILE